MKAERRTVLVDVAAPGLKAVFCGLNPGRRAAASGHHFEGRGNRFWKVLHLAGFTDTQLRPEQDRCLLGYDYGLTTAVARPTASAREIDHAEYLAGAASLEFRLAQWQPGCVAFLGKAACAALLGRSSVEWGALDARIGGVPVWVLPNPSGLNRGFGLDALVEAYRELRLALEARFPDQAGARLRWNSANTAAAISRIGEIHRPALTEPVASDT